MASDVQIPVIDLFAGPGGLGEGFSAFDDPGFSPFKIGISIEKDAFAHQTLRLRSFYRQFAKEDVPSAYYEVLREFDGWRKLPGQFSDTPSLRKAWESADGEAMHAELGPASHAAVRERSLMHWDPRRNVDRGY